MYVHVINLFMHACMYLPYICVCVVCVVCTCFCVVHTCMQDYICPLLQISPTENSSRLQHLRYFLNYKQVLLGNYDQQNTLIVIVTCEYQHPILFKKLIVTYHTPAHWRVLTHHRVFLLLSNSLGTSCSTRTNQLGTALYSKGVSDLQSKSFTSHNLHNKINLLCRQLSIQPCGMLKRFTFYSL